MVVFVCDKIFGTDKMSKAETFSCSTGVHVPLLMPTLLRRRKTTKPRFDLALHFQQSKRKLKEIERWMK